MITDDSIQNQRRLIGAALTAHSLRDQLAMAPAQWFTDWGCRLALDMVNKNRYPDVLAFWSDVLQRGLAEEMGGGDFIADAQDCSIFDSEGFSSRLAVLRQAYVLHRVECLPDAIKRASSAGVDANERISILETEINDIRQLSETGASSYNHIKVGCLEASEDILAVQTAIEHNQPTEAIPTGIADVDAYLFGGGFHRGQMIVVGARPGVGKSSFMINCALNQAKQKRVVGIISLEMMCRHLAELGAQISAGVNLRAFYTRKMLAHECQNGMAGFTAVGSYPIYVDDSSTMTIDQIVGRMAHMVRVEGCEIIYVDYAQKITTSGKKDLVQELSHISARLTQAAKELDVPVVALAQLNRGVAGEVPRLDNLKGTGQFEQDAHIALLLHRPEATNEGDFERMELIIAKQRRGIANASIDLRFDRATQRIT